MKKISFFFILIIFSNLSFAQYNFVKNNNYYLEEYTSHKTIFDKQSSELISPIQEIPFPFKFYSNIEVEYKIAKAGLITFDTKSTSLPITNNPIPRNDAINESIYALWTDIKYGDTSRVISYTVGKTPSRKHIIKWENVIINDTNTMTFSIVLNEQNSQIDIVYDKSTKSIVSFATIGIENKAGGKAMMLRDTLPKAPQNGNYFKFDKEIFPSVGKLTGPNGFGSGFLITPNVGITAKHVIQKKLDKPSTKFTYNVFYDGTKYSEKLVNVDTHKGGGDFAIFKLNNPVNIPTMKVYARELVTRDKYFRMICSGTSGGYHYARIIAKAGDSKNFYNSKDLDKVSMKAGDSGGVWALEMTNEERPIAAGTVHGGGFATQLGFDKQRTFIDSMVNVYTNGADHVNWFYSPIVSNLKFDAIDCQEDNFAFSFSMQPFINYDSSKENKFSYNITDLGLVHLHSELKYLKKNNTQWQIWNYSHTDILHQSSLKNDTIRLSANGNYIIEVVNSKYCNPIFSDTLSITNIDMPDPIAPVDSISIIDPVSSADSSYVSEMLGVSVSPNPFKKYVQVKSDGYLVQINIVDILGRHVKTYILKDKPKQMKLFIPSMVGNNIFIIHISYILDEKYRKAIFKVIRQ